MTVLSRTLGLVAAGVFCLSLVAPSAHAQITINEARNQGAGASVTVEGTVTRAYGDFVRFQDESGPTGASGLVVIQTSGPFHDDIADGTITQGTQLRVSGTLSEFNGLLEIYEGDLDSYTVQGQGTPPSPQGVTLSTLQSDGEDYESELVSVTGLDFVVAEGSYSEDTSYLVTDGSGTSTFAQGAATFRVQGSGETTLGGESIPEGAFNYTGVVGEFNSQYQLIPVRPADVQVARSFGFTRAFAQAQEGSGTVEVKVRAYATAAGDDVSVTAKVGGESTATNGTDVTGFTSPQTLTFTGDDPPPKTLSFDVASDAETEGAERLEVVLETNDGDLTRPKRFTLWVLDDPTAQGLIAEGDSGDVLIDALQQQYGDPRPLGYGLARDSMYARIYNEEANTVEGTYSGFEITVDPAQGDPSTIAANKGINTEHTWPQSKGAGQEPARSNLHILVPTREEVNSARSNLPYGESPDPNTNTWYFEDQSQSNAPPEADRPLWSELLSSQKFEPRHSVKGDVARAVFYFVTVYPNRANFSFFDAQRDTLLAWHEQDPVDATEMRRNLMQASYQDNALNPFVVDSTLVDRAYGSGADTDDDPPVSGTFELFADESDIDPGSGNVDAQCLVQLPSSGDLVFFNSEEGGIFVWDGSSLTTHRSASDLNSDVPDESSDFNRCDGVAIADGFVYFVLRSDQGVNYVYRTEAADASNNAYLEFDGATSLAADANTVYIGGSSGLGAPSDGVFEISSDLSGSATEVASNSDVDAATMNLSSDGTTLYGFSSGQYGNGDFSGTVFSLDVSASSPSFSVFTNPYAGNSPLTPNSEGGGINDLQRIDFSGTSYLVVSNESDSGWEWATIEVGSGSVELLFEQSDLETRLGVGGYDAFTAPLVANSDGEVFVASGGFGPDYIAKVSEAPPLPVEMASFDAVKSGSAVELTWQTASETNNAGFQVQRKSGRKGAEWTQIGFREGGGTTEGAQSYRFTDATPPFDADALTYRLKQVDLDGSASYSEPVTVHQTVEKALLRAPFPNPTREQATVQFAVPERQEVTLRLYDVLGRQVRTLVDGARAGRQQAQVDVSDLSSGVYFLRLQADAQVRTQRVTVVQ